MAQMNGMEKRNFTNSVRNGGKTAKMRNNSAKSGMVGMSVVVVANVIDGQINTGKPEYGKLSKYIMQPCLKCIVHYMCNTKHETTQSRIVQSYMQRVCRNALHSMNNTPSRD